MSGRTKRPTPTKPPRTRTKELCEGCPALCCHDLAVVIERPRNRRDIEFYKWHLQYDTVSIAISNYRWHLLVKGRCIYLTDDNLCSIYDRRPRTCRRHNPPDCERFGPWYDTLLSTPEELEEYIRKEKERRRRRRARARRR